MDQGVKGDDVREYFWNDVDECIQSFGPSLSNVLSYDLNARTK